MLFASAVGDFFLFGFFLLCMFLICVKKVICAVDEGGQIKEKAGQGVVKLIERFMK